MSTCNRCPNPDNLMCQGNKCFLMDTDFDGDGKTQRDGDNEYLNTPNKDFLNYKKRKPMLKRLLASKIVRGIGSVLGGVVGAGGSILAGLDPEFAVLVGVTAVIAIFGGIKKAQAFYDIFDQDVKKDSK